MYTSYIFKTSCFNEKPPKFSFISPENGNIQNAQVRNKGCIEPCLLSGALAASASSPCRLSDSASSVAGRYKRAALSDFRDRLYVTFCEVSWVT